MRKRKHPLLKKQQKQRQQAQKLDFGKLFQAIGLLLVNALPFIVKGLIDVIRTQITGKSEIHRKTNIYRNKRNAN